MRRSPCTSLYGSQRPTTGTESLQTRKTLLIQAKARATEDEEADAVPKKSRGRPAQEVKASVKEEMLPDFVARAAHVLELNGGSMDSNLFGQHWKQVHPANPIYGYKTVKGVTIHQMLRENSRFFEVSDTTRHKVKFFTLVPGEVGTFLGECTKQGYFSDSSKLVASMAEAVKSAVDNIDVAIPVHQEVTSVLSMDTEDEQLSLVTLELLKASAPAPVASSLEKKDDFESVVHDYVPMQGKSRRQSGFDRRKQAPARVTKESRSLDSYREVLPQAPVPDKRDAIKNQAVSLYNSWAMDGRDVVMEVTHATAFEEMWDHVKEEKLHPKREFTAIDGGCGNGWATRKMAEHPLCQAVVGVDAAARMVDRAQSLSEDDIKVSYKVGDVGTWIPKEEVDLVNLCETLYLIQEPLAALKHIVPTWLKPGGLLIASLDCYWENKLSHAWEGDLGVPMQCLSEKEWEKMFEDAGLVNVVRWRSMQKGPWQGTLLISGERRV